MSGKLMHVGGVMPDARMTLSNHAAPMAVRGRRRTHARWLRASKLVWHRATSASPSDDRIPASP
eukprot:scaffold12824_cov26-Tisochrysis_lutea.AAC.2